MTTTELDTKTDSYAKSDATLFPLAEKLGYYNEADGILNALIIKDQEDRNEEEDTTDTEADGTNYQQEARIHHINWLKINYGNGFVPARYRSELDLIAEYGDALEGVLSNWDGGSPIYNFKGSSLFVYPAPTAAQAGTDRLKVSLELIPDDIINGGSPTLVPPNFHYLHATYAAMSWLDEDDPLHAKAEKRWLTGVPLMLDTMYPRARQRDDLAATPDDDGSNY